MEYFPSLHITKVNTREDKHIFKKSEDIIIYSYS